MIERPPQTAEQSLQKALEMDGLVDKGFFAKVPVNKVKSNYVKGEQFDTLISNSSLN